MRHADDVEESDSALRSFHVMAAILLWVTPTSQTAGGTTYYVSSSTGDDGNDGLSPGAAFESIDHVNGLNLGPGDTVLFKCGDTWRAESLVVTRSGASGNPITYGSYPAGCANKPIFSGAQPITSWSVYSGNIYTADLASGGNAGRFPLGINQLFEGETRLPFGRWPNLSSGDGGYSTIDGHTGNNISDNQVLAINWSGARAHIKGMRWYILNRAVSSSSGTTLTLSSFPDCWGGDCQEWGYFPNNRLGTLDQEGEWYYDEASNRVYLYRGGGAPSNIEGSVVVPGADEGFHGEIILGEHLNSEIQHVVIENLEVSRWFDNGITTPRNLETTDNSDVTIRDVDNAGIYLATLVWNAGPNSGWRGGRNIVVEDSVIERANHTAINSYTTESTFCDNVIRDIALIENLGRDGMGCPLDQPAFSGFGNTIEYNRLERTGSSGIQLFGANNVVQYNVVQESGYAKGDNGGISVYRSGNFASTTAHDITIRSNIVLSPTGNSDGAAPAFGTLSVAHDAGAPYTADLVGGLLKVFMPLINKS